MRQGQREWTTDDDRRLKEAVIQGSSVEEIADKIGRTISAIQTRAYVLRIALKPDKARRLRVKK